MKKVLVAVGGMVLLGYVQIAIGQQSSSIPSNPGDVVARVQGQLESRYPLAQATADGGDIVAGGAVVVLLKDNLVMNKVFLNATQRSALIQNSYDNGQITQIGLMAALSKLNSVLSTLGNTEGQSRTFVRGERLSVTKILVQADGIVFQLLSDPIDNVRYHGALNFPYADIRAADQVAALVPEVLTTDSPTAGGGANAQVSGTAPVADESEETRRAEGGDVDAMYRLGNALAQRGANVDAVRWFRQASDKGHVKATNSLGFMYEEGRGVPQNYEQASKLYLKAMKRGNPDAMVNRAILFARGQGVKKDPLQAYVHLLLAAAYAADQQTRDAAVKLKDEVAAKLSKQQITRGQVLADKFAKDEIK